MAGGVGSRLWPLSTRQSPKPLLNVGNSGSLLAQTINNLSDCDSVSIVCSRAMAKALAKEPKTTSVEFIIEPAAKNTAAAIAVAAWHIAKTDPTGEIAIVPADHYIQDTAGYRRSLSRAYATATSSNALVTLGVTPTSPHTGYGYIEVGENHKVVRFTEKPEESKAKEFLRRGNFLWNAGIFVAKVEAFQNLIKVHLPKLALAADDHTLFDSLESISFDYGVVEKAKDVRCLPLQCDWSDVGNFTSLAQTYDSDESGNQGSGRFLASSNCFVHSESAVSVVGLDNVCVIEKDGQILVVSKEHAEKVKKLSQ